MNTKMKSILKIGFIASVIFITLLYPALMFQQAQAGSLVKDAFSPTALTSDDFNTCTLDSNVWEMIDPLEDADMSLVGTFTDDAQFSISVPAGISHDNDPIARAPRIMQAVDNQDFVIEVKFDSPFVAQSAVSAYQTQGIMIEQTQSQDYLRFEFFSQASNLHLYAAKIVGGVRNDILNVVIGTTGTAPMYMRVTRAGSGWNLEYSLNGTDWTLGVAFTKTLIVNKVGVYAGNAGTEPPAHTGLIDYFSYTAAPIESEDGARNQLTTAVSPDLSGSVEAAPVKENYACFDEVTLTATEEPGWSFLDWSGGLTGTTNPSTISMTGSTTVTANFEREEYALSVNKVGSGTVLIEPEQPVYYYGDQITVTAVPEAGWYFSDWSGDITSSNNPLVFQIEQDTDLTVTFDQTPYTLAVDKVGSGTFEIEPLKPNYYHGDVITITATPEANWFFAGWSGDITSSENPLVFPIEQDTAITVTFKQAAYTLDVTKIGNGTITVEPQQAAYHYGDQVTLSGIPDSGWKFVGWQGDISSSDNPFLLTITGDTALEGVFELIMFDLFLPFVNR